MTEAAAGPAKKRVALVLSGGGSRGAYEAGFLSWLFEHIYPRLGERFEFDIVSGTSVGAIHAAYVACSSGLRPNERARDLIETWNEMRFDNVLRVSWRDLVGIPLRSLGLVPARERETTDEGRPKGGLVDISPLEALVRTRIPWSRLRANLASARPGVLVAAVTDVRTGIVRVFLDGPLADTNPWRFDPHVDAVKTEITPLHVRASAAIPFLFPAVCIDGSYFVDGGLRLNTPMSPALKLQADKILVVGLKKPITKDGRVAYSDAEALTKPAFLLGKLLNVLLLDPIENELHQLEIINALLAGGKATFGPDFAERLAPTLRAVRGVAYKPVEYVMQNPSADLGRIAADCYHRGNHNGATRGLIAGLIKNAATLGVPEDEADFLSYIYFDRAYTRHLLDLGREDAKASTNRILELLSDDA